MYHTEVIQKLLHFLKSILRYYTIFYLLHISTLNRGNPLDRVSVSEFLESLPKAIKDPEDTLGYTSSQNLLFPKFRQRKRKMSFKRLVGCQLCCRPRHLTIIPNYEALLAVFNFLAQVRNIHPETFMPISTFLFYLQSTPVQVLTLSLDRNSKLRVFIGCVKSPYEGQEIYRRKRSTSLNAIKASERNKELFTWVSEIVSKFLLFDASPDREPDR